MAVTWIEAVCLETDEPCLEAIRDRGSHAFPLPHSMSEADQSTRKHFLLKCQLVARRWKLDDQWLGKVIDIIDFMELWSNHVCWLTAAMVATKSLEDVEEHILSMKSSKKSLHLFLNEISQELFGLGVTTSIMTKCFAREAALLSSPTSSGHPIASVNATTVSIFAALRMCSLLPEHPTDNARDWKGMMFSSTGGSIMCQPSLPLLGMPPFVQMAICLVQECSINNAVVARGLAPNKLACAALFASIRGHGDAPASVHTAFATMEGALLGIEFLGTSKTLAENLGMVANAEDVQVQVPTEGEARLEQILPKAQKSIPGVLSDQEASKQKVAIPPWIRAWRDRLDAARLQKIACGVRFDHNLSKFEGSTRKTGLDLDIVEESTSIDDVEVVDWCKKRDFGGHAKKAVDCHLCKVKRDQKQRGVICSFCRNTLRRICGHQGMTPLRDASLRSRVVTESRQARARLDEKRRAVRGSIQARLHNLEAELSELRDSLQAQSWSLPTAPQAFDGHLSEASKRWGRKTSKASTCHLCHAARSMKQRGILCPSCLRSLRRITGSQSLSPLGCPDVRDQVLTLSKGKGEDHHLAEQKRKIVRKLKARIQGLRNKLDAAV